MKRSANDLRVQGQRAAGCFDRSLGTGRRTHALQQRPCGQLARLDDLDVLDQLAEQAGLLQRLQIDLVDPWLADRTAHFAVDFSSSAT
jgi:hypothetical protein